MMKFVEDGTAPVGELQMDAKLYESASETCKCGGRWRVLYEVASSGGGGYYLKKCPVSDGTTGILKIANSAGVWRLEHQSAGSDTWNEITNRDQEIQEASQRGMIPQT